MNSVGFEIHHRAQIKARRYCLEHNERTRHLLQTKLWAPVANIGSEIFNHVVDHARSVTLNYD